MQGIHGGWIVSVRLLLIKSEANVCRGRKTNFLSTLLGLSLDTPITNDRLMGEKQKFNQYFLYTWERPGNYGPSHHLKYYHELKTKEVLGLGEARCGSW